MRTIYDQVAKVAASNLNVLILGERGVGKEILARAVHNASPRSKGPFMALNCAALTESLLESELFGNEKGAYTGAVQARAGLLETAASGTVFLDEVGEMPSSIQATLLRVLEDRKVRRVGGRVAREIDVRFVAATNRDVESDAARGSFRADLFDRLNAFTITIPPLRDRVEEVAPLARMFVARACAASGKGSPLPITDESLELLEQYAWPGNVRELKNAIEVAVALCETSSLRPEDLPPRLRSRPRPSPRTAMYYSPSTSADVDPRTELRKQAEEWERQRILDALTKTANNQTLAAKLLGIARRTLLNRMNALGIDGPRKKRSEDTPPDTLRSSQPPPEDENSRDRTKRPTITEEGETPDDEALDAYDRITRKR
jgi:DNA-binding NtrC family response regulator